MDKDIALKLFGKPVRISKDVPEIGEMKPIVMGEFNEEYFDAVHRNAYGLEPLSSVVSFREGKDIVFQWERKDGTKEAAALPLDIYNVIRKNIRADYMTKEFFGDESND